MPSKYWEGLRWVLPPTGRIPSFEGEHRGLVCGSVAGRPNSPPLLIRNETTAFVVRLKWYASTISSAEIGTKDSR
jgi:hypothetical protein